MMRMLDNIRECNCFLRTHWLSAFWIVEGIFVWIPKDLGSERYGDMVLDLFVIVVNGWSIWLARHKGPPKRRGDRAPEKKWADLVRSWRKPVAVPV